MEKRVAKTGLVILLLMGMVLSRVSGADAQSLYEQYAGSNRDQLEEETAFIGRQLAQGFSQDAIVRRQQQIDFAEYFSNLKKALLYGARLASYVEYERDLQFARDHEVFQGLPETAADAKPGDREVARKEFTGKKYQRMKNNIEEEIETYADLMVQSLDACEDKANHDQTGFRDNRSNLERVRELLETAPYRVYRDSQAELARGWPELASRLVVQLDLWLPQAPGLSDALIDRTITGAL